MKEYWVNVYFNAGIDKVWYGMPNHTKLLSEDVARTVYSKLLYRIHVVMK